MKRLLFISLFLSLCCISRSQDLNVSDVRTPDEGSIRYGDIFDAVSVEQSEEMRSAFRQYVSSNSDRKMKGYRVRIYFDSSQKAREVSASIAARFSSLYPGVPVYRNYVSPFFKVTVGDFRTRDEAHRFSTLISEYFPSTFLVKENIKFPSLWSNRD